jgi:ATP-binding cassette subfamily F protein uup
MQLIKRPNFLILDEPTNDLDVFTLALLENFLIAFEGCLVIVSHDRFFLDKLVDHVFVFEGNGKIKDHYGNYSDYYRWKIAEDKRKRLQEKSTPKENQPVKQVVAAGTKPTYKQQKEYEALTQEIAALEAEKHQLVERMNSGAESVAGLQELSCRFAEIEKLLAEKEDRWLQLAELF